MRFRRKQILRFFLVDFSLHTTFAFMLIFWDYGKMLDVLNLRIFYEPTLDSNFIW